MTRVILSCLALLALAACGGSPAASTGPGRTTGPSGQATTPAQQASQPAPVNNPPAAATPAPGGGGGSPEAIVRALIPPNALELNHAQVGNSYTVQLSSQSSLADLQAFWDQKIPTTGVTQSGKFNQADSLVYAFTNPDGGITAGSDGSGGVLITISAGTSS